MLLYNKFLYPQKKQQYDTKSALIIIFFLIISSVILLTSSETFSPAFMAFANGSITLNHSEGDIAIYAATPFPPGVIGLS